jgi:uncharacterized OB-fold protein
VTTPPARPLGQPRGEEQRYFADLREHLLPYYYCAACDIAYTHPQEWCPPCVGEVERRWSCGEGRLYSYTTLYRAGHPAFAETVPYTIALVDFPEGFRALADLTVPPGADEPRIGQPVRVEFEDVTADMTLAHFVVAA